MRSVAALTLVAGLLAACGGSGGRAPDAAGTAATARPASEAPSRSADGLLAQARAALFGRAGVLHITASGELSNQVLEYSQAWIERGDDRVRLDINDERRTGDPNAADAKLIVDGQEYIGLSKDAGIDPLATLLPLEHFTLVTPATEAQVSIIERSGSIVLKRSYPETTHIELQCAVDVRVYFDERSLLPTRVEQEQYPCAQAIVPNVPHSIAAADLTYETLTLADVPSDFFDPEALRASFLAERLQTIRAGTFQAYWLGESGLSDVWAQIDPLPYSGARFFYGQEQGSLVIDSFPPDTTLAEPCPSRDNGIVVGSVAIEEVETALGAAEYCPSDGWLRIVASGTRVYLWPGIEHDETKDDMVAIADRLRVVE